MSKVNTLGFTAECALYSNHDRYQNCTRMSSNAQVIPKRLLYAQIYEDTCPLFRSWIWLGRVQGSSQWRGRLCVSRSPMVMHSGIS
jgi:hypothetical protein